MKSAPVKTRIVRGYARNKSDEARLKAAGVKTVYRLDEGETFKTKFKMRSGEGLAVVDGLRIFGHGKRAAKDIADAIKVVHGWGATVVDVETDQNSRDHGIVMMEEALRPPGQSPEHLERMRKLASDKKTKDGRMPLRQVEVLWFRHPEMSVEEIVQVSGWPSATLYTKLLKRKTTAGRRPKAILKSD